ncbi:urea carboxylase [Biscogniauxia mediterranea]|nr:urea carboxylase [Biscogniauxia mediterranea]
MMQKLHRVLIANRGEIAVRCINACRQLSIQSIAIFTRADAGSLHARLADKGIMLEGEGQRAYTDIASIIAICRQESVDGVLPGYGFLSENPDFARRVSECGMVFIGPGYSTIEAMGLKHRARKLAQEAGVPVVPGSGLLTGSDDAVRAAEEIGYPIMLKASGGGGGMGMQICSSKDEVAAAFGSVLARSKELFADTGVFLERYYPNSHHIEVQVFGNGTNVIHFGERECSIQRRHQKVVEECPSPYVSGHLDIRAKLTSAAVTLAKSIGYMSAGTVEFLVDDETGGFFFLEMNTRLQVEHGITEMCYGVDLVHLMLRQADYQLLGQGGIPDDQLLPLQKERPNGAAIELRLYSENPVANFYPSTGTIQEVRWPTGDSIRIDTWVQTGTTIGSHFDPLLAKVMIHRPDRPSAIEEMKKALAEVIVGGIITNKSFLGALIQCEGFIRGSTLTNFLQKFEFHPAMVEVISPGSVTTIQQLPGRIRKGYGVPRSGPMDDISSHIANLLVGNDPHVELLEITMVGPQLLFHTGAIVAVCGAQFEVNLDGKPQSMWSRINVQASQRLEVGKVVGAGCRCYIAIKGGFPEIPKWLGSKSTTPSLGMGGLQGRQLRHGDYLEIAPVCENAKESVAYTLPMSCIPDLDTSILYVMQGPHDSDDYITASGREKLYNTEWKVSHNSSRTGIRLIGPAPEWARVDGGAGGAHPSNVIDYPYPSPGGVNWTGDSAVIFPQDAPGLGGFICSSTVISADLWKLGQLRPGDTFSMRPVSYASARELATRIASYINSVRNFISAADNSFDPRLRLDLSLPLDTSRSILKVLETGDESTKLTIRQGADSFIIVDIGNQTASLATSIEANLLARALGKNVNEDLFVQVNISSIMIEYNPEDITQDAVVSLIEKAKDSVDQQHGSIPSRQLRLPIVFDHPTIQEAQDRYAATQRAEAAYLPDNVTYIQENNGLPSRDSVFDILRRTRFVVVAVGFMSGLPILLPLDPLSRLVAQKYNPSRVFTPKGTVGLGGSLFCIYPDDHPGGYMLAAKTLAVWDTYGLKPNFANGKPWLCEPFDIVTFFEVDIPTFDTLQEKFDAGIYQIDMSDISFDVESELDAETRSLATTAVLEFQKRQNAAASALKLREDELYAKWQKEQEEDEKARLEESLANAAEEGVTQVVSHQEAKVWKVEIKEGEVVSESDTLVVLEAMKMEIDVKLDPEFDGMVVNRVWVKPGSFVSPGQILLTLRKKD